MKRIFLFLLLTIVAAQAQGPDQEYIRIYNLITQTETIEERGDKAAAIQQYRDAYAALQKLQSMYPRWNTNVVKFRLSHLARKLQSAPPVAVPKTALSNIATNAAVATKSATPAAAVDEQIRRLESENATLEAKLKEALSAQPAASSAESARAEQRILALEKQRDLLKVALEQERADPKQSTEAGTKKNSSADRDEVEQLRAKVAALEARPEPYTSEELALFKQSPAQLAPVESKPEKKSKELPPGSGPLVAQAERAFAARRFDEAEQKYQEVLKQDEDNVYILGNLAATQLEMGNVAAAEKTIRRALEADPDDAFCLTLFGMIKFRQDNFDEALNALSRAAMMDPNNPETQNYLGITLSQKGQRAAAEAALRKAVKLQPNYAGAHHNLAVIYATQKPPFIELARWHYEKALALGHSKNSELESLLNK